MGGLPGSYLLGIELFNAGRYFECHEALEEAWVEADGVEREFLRAMIQAAAALHHHARGNLKGAASLSSRAGAKLSNLPGVVMRTETAAMAAELGQYLQDPGKRPPSWRLVDNRDRS